MSTFPAITAQRLIKALRNLGFEVIRKKGSHHFLRHSDGRCTVVPVHRGETIGRGLLAQIMRDCEITIEDIEKLIWANKAFQRPLQGASVLGRQLHAMVVRKRFFPYIDFSHDISAHKKYMVIAERIRAFPGGDWKLKNWEIDLRAIATGCIAPKTTDVLDLYDLLNHGLSLPCIGWDHCFIFH